MAQNRQQTALVDEFHFCLPDATFALPQVRGLIYGQYRIKILYHFRHLLNFACP